MLKTAIIFVGPPGSGKGTQVPILRDEFGFSSFSVGDAFRAEIAKGSPLGKQVQDFLSRGCLIADDIVLETVKEALASFDSSRVLFDGFPRTIGQVEGMARFMPKTQWTVSCIYFSASDEVVSDRIAGRFSCKGCGRGYNDKFLRPKIEGVCDACGGREFDRRADDIKGAVLTRLEKYRTMTEPLLDYYRREGCLFEVRAEQEIEQVSRQVRTIVEGLLGKE